MHTFFHIFTCIIVSLPLATILLVTLLSDIYISIFFICHFGHKAIFICFALRCSFMFIFSPIWGHHMHVRAASCVPGLVRPGFVYVQPSASACPLRCFFFSRVHITRHSSGLHDIVPTPAAFTPPPHLPD